MGAVFLKMTMVLLQISEVMELSWNSKVSCRHGQAMMESLQSHRHIYSLPRHKPQVRLSRAGVAASSFYSPFPKALLHWPQLVHWPQGNSFLGTPGQWLQGCAQRHLIILVWSHCLPPAFLTKEKPKSKRNHTACSKRHDEPSLVTWSQDPFSSLIC